MSGWQLLAVAVGGALGSVLRFVATRACLTWCPGYLGLGTLLVNVVGAGAIGFLAGGQVEHRSLTPELRLFLVTGLLGGLTTFSALALETALLSRDSLWVSAGHLSANVIAGLIALLIGEQLGRVWSL